MSGFNINHIVLSGNLTRDPELRSTSGGTSVCGLRIANNTRRKDQASGDWVDKPNYFDVTIWGAIGENLAQRLGKGDRIVVDGRIEWREWEDNNGNKRQSYDIVADSVVDMSASSGGSGGSYQSDVPADTTGLDPAAAPPPAAPAGAPAPSSKGGPDDDIPF